jgi:hypothetical protein
MFGGERSDELFGLWYPPESSAGDPTPIIEIGSIFEPGCMALAATNLPAFLRAWSGYFMAMMEAPEPALKALGLPKSLCALTNKLQSEAIAPYLA